MVRSVLILSVLPQAFRFETLADRTAVSVAP